MMNHNQRGLVGVGIERGGQPRALRFAQQAVGDEGFLQRIEQKPIRLLPAQNGGLATGQTRRMVFASRKTFQKCSRSSWFPMLSEWQSASRMGRSKPTTRSNPRSRRIERQIPIDEHRPRQLRPGQDFCRHGFQIIGHVHRAGDFMRVRRNVNIRKQRHVVCVPFGIGQRTTLGQGKRGSGARTGQESSSGNGRQINWHCGNMHEFTCGQEGTN